MLKVIVRKSKGERWYRCWIGKMMMPGVGKTKAEAMNNAIVLLHNENSNLNGKFRELETAKRLVKEFFK